MRSIDRHAAQLFDGTAARQARPPIGQRNIGVKNLASSWVNTRRADCKRTITGVNIPTN
jgi:hypothetical protein